MGINYGPPVSPDICVHDRWRVYDVTPPFVITVDGEPYGFASGDMRARDMPGIDEFKMRRIYSPRHSKYCST